MKQVDISSNLNLHLVGDDGLALININISTFTILLPGGLELMNILINCNPKINRPPIASEEKHNRSCSSREYIMYGEIFESL